MALEAEVPKSENAHPQAICCSALAPLNVASKIHVRPPVKVEKEEA